MIFEEGTEVTELVLKGMFAGTALYLLKNRDWDKVIRLINLASRSVTKVLRFDPIVVGSLASLLLALAFACS